MFAAKSSAGELEKTKSWLRIPQRPRVSPFQRRQGRNVEQQLQIWAQSPYVAGSGITAMLLPHQKELVKSMNQYPSRTRKQCPL